MSKHPKKDVLSRLLGLLASMDVLKYYHLVYGGNFLNDLSEEAKKTSSNNSYLDNG